MRSDEGLPRRNDAVEGSAEVGEDRHLWQRLRADGARLLGVDDLVVTTSGRLVGRAPGGFADYLARLVGEAKR